MFRNRILKILALLMVLNILIIPLTSFTPQQQNKYKVYAAEGLVDIRFFNAVISMIGITAAGLATMSPSFSIPEADLVEMKNNFAQSLEADAVKKQAWMAAQTDYLAGGIAKTMGAVELAKIGIYDIYNQFKNYLNDRILNTTFNNNITSSQTMNIGNSTVTREVMDINNFSHVHDSPLIYKYTNYYESISQVIGYTGSTGPIFKETYINANGYNEAEISIQNNQKKTGALIRLFNTSELAVRQSFYNTCLEFGIDLNDQYPDYLIGTIKGSINYNDDGSIINTDSEYIHIFPTIPWIDTSVPVGTIVTPAIAAPYAGTVPIDVPITAPIDPPIDVPDNPPADTTLLGTVAAILAGLTPIAGFLEYILSGQVSLTDTIEAGITSVIDGIGDIAGTLTGGITSSLTDIQTSIGSLLDPPTETLDLDKLKNLNSVLFTKFPFSIPFDFIAIVTAINADPLAPVLTIPFNMQDFGGSNSNVEIDLSIYDNFANIARQIGFIGFVIFMLFNTRKLIWK